MNFQLCLKRLVKTYCVQSKTLNFKRGVVRSLKCVSTRASYCFLGGSAWRDSLTDAFSVGLDPTYKTNQYFSLKVSITTFNIQLKVKITKLTFYDFMKIFKRVMREQRALHNIVLYQIRTNIKKSAGIIIEPFFTVCAA